jgi:hypothetical protein
MREGIAARVMLAGLAATLVAGCGRTPVKAYDGPSRPLDQLSVLQGGASGDEMSARSVVEFPEVDGVRRSGEVYVVSVLPGSHRVRLKQTLQFGSAKRVQYCTFQVQTAADCQYTPIPPSPPPDSVSGKGKDFRWSVDLPVNIQCGGRAAYLARVGARCGSADEPEERPDR